MQSIKVSPIIITWTRSLNKNELIEELNQRGQIRHQKRRKKFKKIRLFNSRYNTVLIFLKLKLMNYFFRRRITSKKLAFMRSGIVSVFEKEFFQEFCLLYECCYFKYSKFKALVRYARISKPCEQPRDKKLASYSIGAAPKKRGD